jgi:hypothetical protein
MCPDNAPDVCPIVGCVDKKADPSNCGSCGNKCSATASCYSGACSMTRPTLVLPPVAGCNADGMTPMTLAVSGTAVYYADMTHGTINKLGTQTPVVSGEMSPIWLTASGADLYWYAKGAKSIHKVAAAGGTVVNIYTNNMPSAGGAALPPSIGGFAVSADAMNVYISVGTLILQARADGSQATATTPTVVASEVHGGIPGAIAVSGNQIVFPTLLNSDVDAPPIVAGQAAVCGMEDAQGNVITTTCPRLARSQGELFVTAIFAIGGRAYWFDGPNVKGEALTNPNQTFDSITAADNPIVAVAATADTIYFASVDPAMPKTAVISKTALTKGSAATQMALAQNSPTSMAVDASRVYWANADCSIASLPK